MRLVFVLDCNDPLRLAPFWEKALGYRLSSFDEPYAVLLPLAPGPPEILLQRVPEHKAGKNRMHLDIRIDHLEAERDRMIALGATVVNRLEELGFRWYVLADPEGNEFCIVEEPPKLT
jgi:predicted enzyme related to lactoylglutathione lyase